MKKILTHLTGIVFIITILIAGGCKVDKEEDKTAKVFDPKTSDEYYVFSGNDTTTVEVYLKDTLIGCIKHLEMYNVKFPGVAGDTVIDTLETIVYPGYTVIWKKAHKAEIKKVHHLRIMDSTPWNLKDSCIVTVEDSARALTTIVIPLKADSGIVKYEIIFEDKDGKFWCIDPYLRIPDLEE